MEDEMNMTKCLVKQECLVKAKNRVSFICIRSAEIRRGTSVTQSEAMMQAHKEWDGLGWHFAGKVGKNIDRKCRSDDLFLSRGCILECGNCGARDDGNG
jgi:hypothetical protein